MKTSRLVHLFAAACLTLGIVSSTAAQAQHHGNPALGKRLVTLTPSSARIEIGQSVTFVMPTAYRIDKLFIQAEGTAWGPAAAEVFINGDKIGDLVVPRVDPNFTMNVNARVSNSVTIFARRAQHDGGPIVIRGVRAVVEDVVSVPSYPTNPNCGSCGHLPFPTYYSTVISNVSNQAIILVNELEGYTNYRDYGTFLLPIKKAAVRALSVAEANGDASAKTRPFALELLQRLDCSEQYLDNMFEIDQAFRLSQELLSLREYIREILD